MYDWKPNALPLICVSCWEEKNGDYVRDLRIIAAKEQTSDDQTPRLATGILAHLGLPFDGGTISNTGFAIVTHVATDEQRSIVYGEQQARHPSIAPEILLAALFSRDNIPDLWRYTIFAMISPCTMSFHDLAPFTQAIFGWTLSPEQLKLREAAASGEFDIAIQRRFLESYSCSDQSMWEAQMVENVHNSIPHFFASILQQPVVEGSLSLELAPARGVQYQETVTKKKRPSSISLPRKKRQKVSTTFEGHVMLSNVPRRS